MLLLLLSKRLTLMLCVYNVIQVRDFAGITRLNNKLLTEIYNV